MSGITAALCQHLASAALPPIRSIRWANTVYTLRHQFCLPLLHGSHREVWNLLQPGRVCPKDATWGMLLQDHDTTTLLTLTMRRNACGSPPGTLAISGWNVSWLVDTTTEAFQIKAAVIDSEMMKGRVLCLQETHWHESEGLLFFQQPPFSELLLQLRN